MKGFNNIYFKHLLNLARPVGAADQSFLPIAGDGDGAKTGVTEFLKFDRLWGSRRRISW